MVRGAGVVACLVLFLFSDGSVVRAAASRDDRHTTADTPRVLSHAIENHAQLFPPLHRAKFGRRWNATQVTITQLAKCGSRKKGTLIGAAMGAVAGAVFGVYMAKEISNGASNGDAQLIAYSSLGGAGVGALLGFAYCR